VICSGPGVVCLRIQLILLGMHSGTVGPLIWRPHKGSCSIDGGGSSLQHPSKHCPPPPKKSNLQPLMPKFFNWALRWARDSKPQSAWGSSGEAPQSVLSDAARAPLGAGIPSNNVPLSGKHSGGGRSASIAEFGTLQLEWVALGDRLHEPSYGERALNIYRRIEKKYPDTARCHCANPQTVPLHQRTQQLVAALSMCHRALAWTF
jgi:hypothetical protein